MTCLPFLYPTQWCIILLQPYALNYISPMPTDPPAASTTSALHSIDASLAYYCHLLSWMTCYWEIDHPTHWNWFVWWVGTIQAADMVATAFPFSVALFWALQDTFCCIHLLPTSSLVNFARIIASQMVMPGIPIRTLITAFTFGGSLRLVCDMIGEQLPVEL